MLHRMLWQSNLDLAEACLRHPFVSALGEGSLDAALFRGYIAQDAFFLRAFVKAYALALARSQDLATAADFHGLIGGTLKELELHRDYVGELGVSELGAGELGVDLARVSPNRACQAYTDFLLRTAWHASLGEIAAAVTPCMRLYAYLGSQLAGGSHSQHPYRRWIETYSGAEFERLAVRVEALLDQVGADTRPVRDSYRYAMQCELDFFSGAMGSTA